MKNTCNSLYGRGGLGSNTIKMSPSEVSRDGFFQHFLKWNTNVLKSPSALTYVSDNTQIIYGDKKVLIVNCQPFHMLSFWEESASFKAIKLIK